ncbi:MAG: hypothetical protein KGZ89_05070 [Actinobacteria bacterium]|nr:hypothetical protein [Actinomycetota bacterium]
MSSYKKKSKWLPGVLVLLLLLGIATFAALRFGIEGLALAPTGPDNVLVVLALPGEDGVILPRVAKQYRVIDQKAYEEPIDLTRSHAIPGTSFSQLRDVYSFEGGRGLARAVSRSMPLPAYIVLTVDDLQTLLGEERFTIETPEHMDVYDGVQLYTFRPGQEMALDASQTVALFMGVEYLSEPSRQTVAFDGGREVIRLLSAERLDYSLVETDLSPEEYEVFLQNLVASGN